jgi:uncharacterized protein (DUF433 family)
MPKLERITFNPAVMGGKPCLRDLRVTVGAIVGLVATGKTRDEILRLYPCLEAGDIDEAMAYAAWRAEEQEVAVAEATFVLDKGIPKMGKRTCFWPGSMPAYARNIEKTAE